MKRTIEIEVFEDAIANAAAITFDTTARGRELRTYELTDGAGTTFATVTFAADGALAQIELLDATTQLPKALRGEGG